MVERLFSKKRPTKLTFDCVGSSNLIRARYDVLTKVMEVDFIGGATYAYDGVPPAHWKAFKEAQSQGKYLAAEIKPNFPARKLEAA